MKTKNPTKKTAAPLRSTALLKTTAQLQPAAPLDKFKQNQLNDFVREIAGEEGLQIISCIGPTEITDETIEQSTKMKIAEIRSVLNHLHSYGLVEYKREKNMQTGWFTYTWKLNTNRALQNFITMKKKEYDTLKMKLAQGEGAQIYRCQKSCSGLEFEKAMEHSFKCPACNCRLNIVDQEEELKKLEGKINTLLSIHTPVTDQATTKLPPYTGEKLISFNR